MSAMGQIKPDAVGRIRQEISIQRLLEWAFADECASVDFEDAGTLAAGYGCTGNAYRMAQRGALGCRIDGGGYSLPDPDADLVASAVACLPEGCGGRRMAVQIAELARARRMPEAYVGVKLRVEPVGWHVNPHGRRAKEESLEEVIDCSGRKARRHDVRWCPVRIVPDTGQVARARRNYLQWWSALLELKITFGYRSDLSRWTVGSDMPKQSPWVN